ncbi:hypothetical protein K1719_001964 [Acacia pycnantha]|nr:hypothetical protein K1719_001964 [Acacia pycnantha]
MLPKTAVIYCSLDPIVDKFFSLFPRMLLSRKFPRSFVVRCHIRCSFNPSFSQDPFLWDGEHITPALFKAIEESRIAIIVFSENYAKSTFCLQELEKIVECFKEESRLIYPVFYYVDPSDLRHTRGSYAEALAQLEEKRFKHERHKVEKWGQALSHAADLKGLHLESKIANEQECITRITSEVAVRINLKPLHVTNYSVGLVSRMKEVISCLDLWSTKEIKMIGIWGAGGIGKSTIARAVYNSIADNFEGVCFLSDVRKHSEMPNGLSHLQEILLGRLVMEKDLKLGDYHEGIPIIEHRLSQKKILLILDDVDESNQLKALAGSRDWFGYGSRIIITTRNKQLLKSHGIKSIYDVKELNGKESLKLLTWHAFEKVNVDSNYMKVCKRVTHYCCGFPLVLEVIGSYLYGKEVHQWSSALDQFKSIPDGTVLNALKLSFHMLEEVEKQVFLDLACFFNGKKSAHVNDMLQCIRGIQPEYAIRNLVDKSLIKIKNDYITMHDLIEDLGKEIVRQESSYEPGERSRLWFYQDILHVLQQDTGTNKIEVIILDLPESIEVQWSGEEFMKMKNLKMLVIRKARFSKSPKYLPNSLRWLEWKGYPFKFLSYEVPPTHLVYLDLFNSSCGFLQPFDKKFPNLSHMNLGYCKFLQQIPNLSGASNLTKLCLEGCTNLIEIHDSIGCLKKLRHLSALGCKALKIFPSRLRLTSLEYLNLNGCSSLQTFPEISIVMKEMETLDLGDTSITELPSSVCNLSGLQDFSLRHHPTHEQQLATNYFIPTMSLKKKQLRLSHFRLSDDSLAFCLSHFTNMTFLHLEFNNFTSLPECIKECHNLKYLSLDHCIHLEHIGGMPPNLNTFSAIGCTSLTESSKRKVFNKASNIQPWKRTFVLPGKELPKGLHYYNQGRTINGTWVDIISSVRNLVTMIMTSDAHIYICDLHRVFFRTELPLVNKWNQVQISFRNEAKEMYFGLYVYNLQSNVENIQFMDPRRYIIVPNLLQKIQEQEDGKDVEEDMNLDFNSTKYVESLDNPMHYQERDNMEKLQPYRYLEILKVDGHSYNNLIELHQINCKNCWRIPTLGQLPALRTLTIEGVESVVAIGSEFFHGDDSASFLPFSSLETLHFENMISWEEWNSIDMDAFPRLHTLRFHDCPKLTGNLPRHLRSLQNLEIERCPLLASSIPKCPCLNKLVIIKSPNVVLQEQELPRYISRLTISGTQKSAPLFEKMGVSDLIIQDCPDAVPVLMTHMPHSVRGLTIANCENRKFDLVSEAPLRYLRRISIYNCKFLRSLFDDMKCLLPNLKELLIKGCPKLEPFSITLPSSLRRLEIRECDKLLSCLTELDHLPTITQLCIYYPKWLCKRHGYLTPPELQTLDSPNIEKIEGEIMSPSLQRLHICDYGFLLEQCHIDSSDLEIATCSKDEDMSDEDMDEDMSDEDMDEDMSDEDRNEDIDWEIGSSSKDEGMNDTTLQALFERFIPQLRSQDMTSHGAANDKTSQWISQCATPMTSEGYYLSHMWSHLKLKSMTKKLERSLENQDTMSRQEKMKQKEDESLTSTNTFYGLSQRHNRVVGLSGRYKQKVVHFLGDFGAT